MIPHLCPPPAESLPIHLLSACSCAPRRAWGWGAFVSEWGRPEARKANVGGDLALQGWREVRCSLPSSLHPQGSQVASANAGALHFLLEPGPGPSTACWALRAPPLLQQALPVRPAAPSPPLPSTSALSCSLRSMFSVRTIWSVLLCRGWSGLHVGGSVLGGCRTSRGRAAWG